MAPATYSGTVAHASTPAWASSPGAGRTAVGDAVAWCALVTTPPSVVRTMRGTAADVNGGPPGRRRPSVGGRSAHPAGQELGGAGRGDRTPEQDPGEAGRHRDRGP